MGHDVQAGDKVAHVTKLHAEFLANNLLESDSMSGPSQLPNVEFHETEPCEVEELHFYIEGISQVTLLRATLKLLEGTGARSTSNSKNTFQIEIAPPHMGDFSEFLVELERFREQSMAVLGVGSRVKSFMMGAEGLSEWYSDTIQEDKLNGSALDSDDLYSAGIVERNTVSTFAPLLLLCHTLWMLCLSHGFEAVERG